MTREAVNDLRGLLSRVSDTVPVYVRVNIGTATEEFNLSAQTMRSGLGWKEFIGEWCYPAGTPGLTLYPPIVERFPQSRWDRTNWWGARYKLNGIYQYHTGDDLVLPGNAEIGEHLYAPRKGIITHVGVGASTWGLVLVIEHKDEQGNTFFSRFAHLRHIAQVVGADAAPRDLRPGDEVFAGQKIAEVGETGMPGVPHIHWDISALNDVTLRSNPFHWPGENLAEVRLHYQDPAAFITSKLESVPKPDPAGDWMAVSGTTGINVRRQPAGALLTSLPFGAVVRVNGAEPGEYGGKVYTWGQITDVDQAGYEQAIGGWAARELLTPVDSKTEEMVVVTDVLNVRDAPTLDGIIVDKLTRGQYVTVTEFAIATDRYVWRRIPGKGYAAERNSAGTWVALERPKQPLPARTTWAGLHTIGAPSKVAETMLRQCAEAGRPLPLAVVVTSGVGCQRVKELSPDTIVIARPVWPDGIPQENGRSKFNQAWFDSYLRPIEAYLPYIDYVQFVNETWPGNDKHSQELQDHRDFYWDLMRACDARGIKCTVLDLAVGNMNDDRWPAQPDQFAVMKPMLEYAAEHGHICMYHAYNSLEKPLVVTHKPEAYSMRWVYWGEQIPTLKFAFGEVTVPEWDGAKFGSPESVVKNLEDWDDLVLQAILAERISPDQVLGNGPFTDNPGQRWANFDMTPVIPLQTEYILSRGVKPPPRPVGDKAAVGINMDIRNPTANPTPDQVAPLSIVRFVLDVSRESGSLDISVAVNTYGPQIKAFNNAGIKCLMVFNQETFGEGGRWPLGDAMTPGLWTDYIEHFASFIGRLIDALKGFGIDTDANAFQIWNEGDKPNNPSGIYIPPAAYGEMCQRVYTVIRQRSQAQIIGQGLCSGQPAYWSGVRQGWSDIEVFLDGIAVHPYGRGCGTYGWLGRITPLLQGYRQVSSLPIWISEFGGIRDETATDDKAAAFIQCVIEEFDLYWRGNVPYLIFFAYGHNQDGCFGAVDGMGHRRPTMWNALTREV